MRTSLGQKVGSVESRGPRGLWYGGCECVCPSDSDEIQEILAPVSDASPSCAVGLFPSLHVVVPVGRVSAHLIQKRS